jgi:hypothetical protein
MTGGMSTFFETKEDCEQLKEPAEANENCDTKIYEWGDPEIDKFIEGYLHNDNFWLAEMLINYYDAKNGLPSFIPIKLKPYFEAIVKTRLEEFDKKIN